MNDEVDLNVPEEPLNRRWFCTGNELTCSQIAFICQIVIVYIIIITSIINISLQIEPQDLWITLLSSCLGYILPSPVLV